MKIKYDILFRIRLSHGYYVSGLSNDLILEPSPSCQRLLDQYGLIFRRVESGIAVYTRVVPNTSPPELFKPFSGSLKFSFIARLNNPYFYNFTNLPDHQLGQRIFYFSNLRDDQASGEKYLSDHIGAQRVGSAIQLVGKSIYNLALDSAVHAVETTLEDVFGNAKSPTPELDLPVADVVDTVQFNFANVGNMQPGRYQASYTNPQPAHAPISSDFYFEPGVKNSSAIGILEIYTDTNDLTDPSANQVPADYRMINANALTRSGADLDVLEADYFIRFEPRSLDWQYRIIRKPENSANILNLNEIGLDGDVAFDAPIISGDPTTDGQALVRSTTRVTMSEAAPSIQLVENSGDEQTPLADLPTPSPDHVLKEDSDDHYFEMYIYV